MVRGWCIQREWTHESDADSHVCRYRYFYKEGYAAVKHEFSDWCDASRCVFAKVDDNTLVELFFDVDPPKLKAWLSKSSTQEISRHTSLCLRGTP